MTDYLTSHDAPRNMTDGVVEQMRLARTESTRNEGGSTGEMTMSPRLQAG
jgi:hypothetical protein